MDQDQLVEHAARALLDHHFPGKSDPPDWAVERARADARVVVEAVDRLRADDGK